MRSLAVCALVQCAQRVKVRDDCCALAQRAIPHFLQLLGPGLIMGHAQDIFVCSGTSWNGKPQKYPEMSGALSAKHGKSGKLGGNGGNHGQFWMFCGTMGSLWAEPSIKPHFPPFSPGIPPAGYVMGTLVGTVPATPSGYF